MPFKKGSSEDTIQKNIAECIRSYKKTGKIGDTTPKDLEHAKKICSAAAYDSAGKAEALSKKRG